MDVYLGTPGSLKVTKTIAGPAARQHGRDRHPGGLRRPAQRLRLPHPGPRHRFCLALFQRPPGRIPLHRHRDRERPHPHGARGRHHQAQEDDHKPQAQRHHSSHRHLLTPASTPAPTDRTRLSVRRRVGEPGLIVPTALAYKGDFFLGNLGEFPVVPGSETVFKLTPSGALTPRATGLTTILGLAFGHRHRMYVLETSNHAGAPTPGTGDIVRMDPSGARTAIVSGLTFPTGMTMGPDGDLWVSDQGFGPTLPGFGEILRIDPN